MANVTQTQTLLDAIHNEVGGTISRGALKTLAKKLNLPHPRWYITDERFRAGRGQYLKVTLAEVTSLGTGYPDAAKRGRPAGAPKAPTTPTVKMARPVPAPRERVDMTTLIKSDEANTSIQQAASAALGVDVVLGASDSIPFIPKVNAKYVPWGAFEDLRTIVESGHFLPVMVCGPSGNGKTQMCEQICAQTAREYVRVNITNQTDEDDLLGGFRLVNGETKFALGPIPLAMLRGAVVNLDEVDLGGAALMCLQPVLEGEPLYLKKIGRYIQPAPGFTVLATANTKGRGDDGKYVHTNIMNEAMLERFAVMYELAWPEANIERQILARLLKSFGKFDSTLVKHLVEFANVTRTNFQQQICNDQIATRRLLHTCRVFAALGSIDKAMTATLSRFDSDTSLAFRNLWNAIHESPAATASPTGTAVPVEPEVI
jgi:MoxR-like ATPase